MKEEDERKAIRNVADKEIKFFLHMFTYLQKKTHQTFDFLGKDVTEEMKEYLEARFNMLEKFSKLERKQLDTMREIMDEG